MSSGRGWPQAPGGPAPPLHRGPLGATATAGVLDGWLPGALGPLGSRQCKVGAGQRPRELTDRWMRHPPLLEGGPWGGHSLAGWASLQPGESWSDPGSRCVTHKCEKQQDGLVVVTTKKACAPLGCPAVSPGSPPALPCPGGSTVAMGGWGPAWEWAPPSCVPALANGISVLTGQGSAERGRLLPLLPPTPSPEQ